MYVGMWVAPSLSSGLGNRLFQFAAAAGAAERWQRPLVFYMPACKESPHGAIASLFRMFPSVPILDEKDELLELVEPPRRFYDYMPIGPAPTTNALIGGFRQSPLYFPETMPQPDWENALGPHARKKIEQLAGLETEEARRQTYAIHVRLGDYRILQHHQVELASYYSKALAKIPAGSRLHLFSDEPNACVGLFQNICAGRGLRLTPAVTQSDVESLYEMALCLGGTITANSTFSWWGAWFAHAAGAAWATYPDTMGRGQPEPTDLFPAWGTVLPTQS